MDSTVPTNHNTDLITSLDQAELKIRRAGIIRLNPEGYEQVEGEELLQKVCGFNLESKTVAQAIKRQITKHEFAEGKDFTTSMLQSSGGRPRRVYHFSVNAANHVLLSAMTQEGKQARQEAIDDKREKQLTDDNQSHHAPENPALEKRDVYTAQTLLEINMTTSVKAIAFAEALGFTGNQKLLSADRLLKSQIGFSPLEAMGQRQLIAPVQKMTFTPTQLGQMMSPPQDPRQVNRLLEAARLQVKVDNQWVPTDLGQPFCEILDTGKAHHSGTPVKQVKWYQTVLDRLPPKPPGESIETSIDQNDRKADPVVCGSDIDSDPVQRKQKRKRNRYELDDYFSLVELGEFIGRSRQHVVEVLEKNRIIKWTGQGKKGKYLLTENGWQYGLMYDPTETLFHNRNSKRLTTSNAQPVLGYDILKFFH
ncbi:hypothetical protein [Endozoicomonas sp. SCSIO W0465]|uniref:hypothetical protein n=1 Tax=Endozoicomonas sp. SCSIO W0465 TaxID=2918516 RepID=UPI002074BAA3|nr:hypothetical protein [Endozoicomonas sp. SCSIO W0465]USE36416.1 hypothetical protein MJO57_31085 [Endozoicomonas sp. SCSIO W0465]